jgi:hypothetical protein
VVALGVAAIARVEVEAGPGGADGPAELVVAPEQPAATTRIEVSKAASLRDASIVSPYLNLEAGPGALAMTVLDAF